MIRAAAAALVGLCACTAPRVSESARPSTREAPPPAAAPGELDLYDLRWLSPSADSAGSMPIGNGSLGLNVWVEADGDLLLLISRTDSFSEASRLLKVGRIRLEFDPPPRFEPGAFEQRLALRDGAIRLRGGAAGEEIEWELFVDSEADVVHLRGTNGTPRRLRATLESWRVAPRRLLGAELDSSWTMRSAPESVVVEESADVVLDERDALAWYHRNEHSIVPLTLRHQGLESLAALADDPLLWRTFGARLVGTGMGSPEKGVLESTSPQPSFELALAAPCIRAPNAADWVERARALSEQSPPARAVERTRRYWNQFWARSWIFVDGDPWDGVDSAFPDDPRPPSRVTQAYLLQRWVFACAGRGEFPIKFNGSIFTVEPRHTAGQPFDADWRRWGDAYWWQNTRLPYHALLGSGDYDLMRSLFAWHARLLPFAQARTRLYHGLDGAGGAAHFPETMTIFGTCSNGDYGWEREGHPANEVLCPWWQWAWNQGPELVALGLDLLDATGDEAFVERELAPLARAVLAWFDQRFERDADGRLRIEPTQALETHWHGVVDDMPTVAGLREITQRLAVLRASGWTASDRDLARRLGSQAPPLPIAFDAAGLPRLAPAARFDPSRQNCESPELYALFPFRAARRGSEWFDAAQRAFDARADRFTNGWPQDGQDAALLGRVEEARDNLLAKVRNHSPRQRFPAMWGPNFDWLPDQCHGANLMITLQAMLLADDGQGPRLFPCWPPEWGVRFRLPDRRGQAWQARRDAAR